jgi:anti-sigma factor RsiW
MAVLNRTKEPEVAEDRNVAQDQTEVREQAPVQDRTEVHERAPVQDQTAVQEAPVTTRRRRWWRRRRDPGAPGAGARAAAAGAGVMATIVRMIRLVVGVAVLLIALGIAFVALKASPANTIVSHVHDWASWLTTPFHNMFHVQGARGTLALNWGIAIVVYLAVAWLITGIMLAPTRAVRRRTTVA